MGFLQRVVNGDGQVTREYASGRGRSWEQRLRREEVEHQGKVLHLVGG